VIVGPPGRIATLATAALVLQGMTVAMLVVLVAQSARAPAVVVTCTRPAPPAVAPPVPGPDATKGEVSPDPPTRTPEADAGGRPASRVAAAGAGLRSIAAELRRRSIDADDAARRVDSVALMLEQPSK
jgi:hypothetical protein